MRDLTADDVRAALLAHFPSDDWIRAFEVPDGPGRATRFCDAMFLHRDPLRGDMIGVEIKVSRSDMRRELKDPAKARIFAERVHDWFVAAPAGVLRGSDVPPHWGWMTVDDGGVRRVREPRRITPVPWEAAWHLAFAGAVQRTAEQDTRPSIPAAVAEPDAELLIALENANADQRWLEDSLADVGLQLADTRRQLADALRRLEGCECDADHRG